ncbi:hypothetical protein L2E82_49778 [Cichorium intybus]|uniref:Uncharacterized protein n=1 Tax=Cichorium intybus TaxID=13427 RepID=A0ACB8Z2H2_CICIN|nr:hypothetical protein L2E82_49778 [Cichorium intybus]
MLDRKSGAIVARAADGYDFRRPGGPITVGKKPKTPDCSDFGCCIFNFRFGNKIEGLISYCYGQEHSKFQIFYQEIERFIEIEGCLEATLPRVMWISVARRT